MPTLMVQIAILALCGVAVLLAWSCFPYPSPLIRRLLPAHKRWPEMQIREWLRTGRYHRAYLDYFYRDPERVAPAGDDVLAPADGLITSTEVRDGVRYLVIALTFWDMHIQRSPLVGRVLCVETAGDDWMDGEGRDFAFLRAKNCPVQKRVVIATAVGTLAVRLITSVAARRIETWVDEGATIERGQRLGRILLGSTVVLELPECLPLLVKVGERVVAGETPVAAAVGGPA